MIDRRTFISLAPAALLGRRTPDRPRTPPPSPGIFVADPDPLALATQKMADALDELDGLLDVLDAWSRCHDMSEGEFVVVWKMTVAEFEDGPLQRCYKRADDAEQRFLEILRARGYSGVQFQGRLFVDSAATLDRSDRFRCSAVVVSIPTILSIDDPGSDDRGSSEGRAAR